MFLPMSVCVSKIFGEPVDGFEQNSQKVIAGGTTDPLLESFQFNMAAAHQPETKVAITL